MPRSLGCTLTLLLLSALPAAAGVDRWTPIGPDGGTIPALAADPGSPGTLYAGSDGGGVWKSTDGGGHWFSASDGLAERGATEVLALAVAPGGSGTVWAGTHAGIYKTTDGGATWRRVWYDAIGPDDTFTAWTVSVTADPGNPGVAWAGTARGWILKTTDGGESWNQVLDVPGKLLFHPAHPDTVYAYGDGLYKSTDGGATWELVSAGGFQVLALDPADPRVLYSGGRANASLYGVWKSVDGGATWSHLSTLGEDFVQTLLVDPSDPSVVLAGTSGSLWRSEDAGTTWQRVALPLIQVLALEADPSRPGWIWLGANDRGVFRSFDSGRTWRTGRQGLAASHLWSAAFDPFRPRTLYAVANNTGVHRSTDAGAVWNRINAGLPTAGGYGVLANAVAAHPLRPGTLFAATETGACRSLDRGARWANVSARYSGAINSVAFDPSRPETLFAGGEDLLRSRDGGRTWKRLSLPGPLSYEPEIGEVFIAPLRPRTVFVLDFNQRRGEARSLFRSSDSGNTWTQVFELGPGPAAIAPHPTVPGRLYLATEHAGQIWASADDGVTWEQVASEVGGGARLTSLLVDRLDPSILYLGTDGAGVLRSRDGGVTWAPLEAGMIAPRITCLAADPRNPRHLVACTQSGGLLEIRLSD